jgi:hypothetical protein
MIIGMVIEFSLKLNIQAQIINAEAQVYHGYISAYIERDVMLCCGYDRDIKLSELRY